ncbi:MAG: WxL domain-containing protein, partial [Enterococcus sp.]|nr:WxL domain-containing protein [Enterococcus sp.]
GYDGSNGGSGGTGGLGRSGISCHLIDKTNPDYIKYVGFVEKTNMFYPIAVQELSLTKNVGFNPEELKTNVVALRAIDSGKGENLLDTELGNVVITATNQAGTAIDLGDVAKKAGKYTLVYTYNGQSISVNLKVEGGAIKTKDLTLGIGDAWEIKDTFESATDHTGQALSLDQLTVTNTDKVDLSKAGSYTITFSYQDGTDLLKKDAKINVIDIKTKALTLDKGAPWTPFDALESVTNVDQIVHSDQAYLEQNVTASAIDKGSGATVDLTQLTANPGTYTVTYTYAGISRSVDVLVEKIELANQSVLPSDIDFGTPPIQYEKDQILDGQTNGKPTEGKIEVKDTRSKTGEGYKVKVSQTQPFIGKDTNEELKNTTFSFKTGTLTNSENLPIAGSNQTIQLIPGQEAVVLATTQGQSRGTTTLPLHTFQLLVPKETEKRKDKYETTLTWTLSDTP